MEEKKQVKREKLTSILAKFIKDCHKGMGDKTNIILPIERSSWCSGWGKNSKWSHTDITLGDYYSGTTIYTFTDRELTEKEFIDMLNSALASSKVNGKVFYDVCGDGYWTPREYRFNKVELYSKPCKEFESLRKYIDKYAHVTIGNIEVYKVSICGKRSSWSDDSHINYLCYNAKKCKDILDTIRKFKGSKDTLKVSTKEYVDHGDEGDYRCAQYQESEWYGHRGNKLCVEVTTPTGKLKLNKEFYW